MIRLTPWLVTGVQWNWVDLWAGALALAALVGVLFQPPKTPLSLPFCSCTCRRRTDGHGPAPAGLYSTTFENLDKISNLTNQKSCYLWSSPSQAPQLQMQVQQSPFGPVLGAVPRFRWPNPSADLLAAAAANLGGEQPQQQQGRPALAQIAAAAAAGANPANANSSLPNRAANLLAHPLLGSASQSGGLVFLPRLP